MKDNLITEYINRIQNSREQPEFHEILKDMTANEKLTPWLETILTDRESVDLYRDSHRGFVLTAYVEGEGRYRFPHDHGQCWVVYAVVTGTIEMGTYLRNSDPGKSEITRESLTEMHAGESQLYLLGQIHDTRSKSQKVIILRLTSCDLKQEEKEGRMKRYPHEVNP